MKKEDFLRAEYLKSKGLKGQSLSQEEKDLLLKLNKDDLTVKVKYEDQHEIQLTSDKFTVQNFESNTAGNKTITIKYLSFTTTVNILVKEKPPVIIDDGDEEDTPIVDENDEENNAGCRGSNITSSALIFTLSLAGLAMIEKKKKRG